MTHCILHVGTEKTGTTTIQRFLGLNARRLLERGFFVPLSLTPYAASGNLNHVYLTTASRTVRRRPDDLQRDLGLGSAPEVEAHRGAVADEFARELALLPTQPAHILLSNEHIHSRLREDADLQRLRSLLEPHCTRFTVVVYLRPQHEVAQSIAITAVRGGMPEYKPVPDFDTPNGFDAVLGVDFGYFDYADLLARLGRVFGEDSLDVRLYEQAELIGRDILSDFFTRLRIDIKDMERPGRENPSLDPTASLLLATMNRHLADHPRAAELRQFVIDYTARRRQGTGVAAPRAAVSRFMARFEATNEAVRARWFPNRSTLFRVSAADVPDGVDQPGLDEAAAFELFSELLVAALDRR